MIGPDGLPAVAVLVDLAPIVPGPHLGGDATIEQCSAIDAIATQFGQVDAVDLERPHVDAAVGIAPQRRRLQMAFLPADGAQDQGVDLVPRGRVVDAIRVRQRDRRAERSGERRAQ